jgi:hypothetical protein
MSPVWKKLKRFAEFYKWTEQNILDYLCFSIIRVSAPFISLDNWEFTVVE